MSKRVTREDIAKMAGVSITAVSRTINNSGYVKQEKKDRIIEAAHSLGYRPSGISLALNHQKTKQIIFFRDDLTGSYFNQMFHGIKREAMKRGYRVLLDAEYDFDNIKNLLIDGIIFPSDDIAEKYARSVGKNYMLPVVTVGFNIAAQFSKSIPEILLDDRKVMNMALDYALNKGHRKIGYASFAHNAYAKYRCGFFEERLVAEQIDDFKNYEICIDAVSPDEKEPIMEPYFSTSEDFTYYDLFHVGEKVAEAYMHKREKATLYICFNDDLAHGMMSRLGFYGIRVPEDVSLIGIDGTYIRNYYQKKLTSVATHPDHIGADCVNLLIDILEKKPYKYVNWSKMSILEGDTVQDIHVK